MDQNDLIKTRALGNIVGRVGEFFHRMVEGNETYCSPTPFLNDILAPFGVEPEHISSITLEKHWDDFIEEFEGLQKKDYSPMVLNAVVEELANDLDDIDKSYYFEIPSLTDLIKANAFDNVSLLETYLGIRHKIDALLSKTRADKKNYEATLKDGIVLKDDVSISDQNTDTTEPQQNQILPDSLNTEEARKWLNVAIEGGLLDANYQPTEKIKTKALIALLADILKDKMGLSVYKPFESLWNVQELSKQRYKSKNEVGKVVGEEEIYKVFSESK
jgi:hypothetical protein